MGSKDDHLFPSLPIQGERGEKKRHRGMDGVFTSHLQNIRLWETIGKSTNEFPRETCRQMRALGATYCT